MNRFHVQPDARFGGFSGGVAAAFSAIFVLSCTPPPPPSAPTPRAIPTQEVGKRALFGYKVAVSKNLIAVGAPHAKSRGYRKAGAVMLFDRTTLTVARKIEAPEPSDGALFGFSLALNDEHLLVGEVGRTIGGAKLAGAAYLFNAKNGRLIHALRESPPHPNAEFGSAVGFIGADPVVSSPASDVLGKIDVGTTYRFRASTGEPMHSFQLANPSASELVGQSLAATGDTLLLGAPATTVGEFEDAGSVFAFDATTGDLTREFREPEPGSGSTFGAALATDGTIAIIGAPNARERAGAAYAYDLSTGTLLHQLHEPLHLQDGDMFGYSVALLDDAIVVGAPHTTVKGIPRSGAVYLLERGSGKTIHRLTVQPIADADLGISVAGSGAEYVSGAQNGPKGGAAYVLEIAPAPRSDEN